MDFDKTFHALTGHNHFPWQKRLYEKISRGEIPARCDIPTGLGKTSVIALWLIALAGKEPGINIPRRLVYVVNRRTIVDQSTEVVISLRNKLNKARKSNDSPLNEIAAALNDMAAIGSDNDDDLLAVSTLRGELADNLQWRFDPLRPAVVIGTVDMIGSKLLFSGYGDSRRVRPLHPGLLGIDTLIVHDEAHLTPAFSRFLHNVLGFQKKKACISGVPPLKVLELSATCRQADTTSFQIHDADSHDARVKERLFAKKQLYLHEAQNGKEQRQKIVELALNHNAKKSRVVVFVRSPEDATKIHSLLKKKLYEKAEKAWIETNNTKTIPKKTKETLTALCEDSISILTGEIRGHERDILLETPGMLPFTGKAEKNKTAYLISTSAGEVGMDLHADHMVSDLSTLDSMIQRLGRVNRFGQTEARVDVVYEASIKERPRQKTLSLFKKTEEVEGGVDVSPVALTRLLENDAVAEAFSPVPEIVETTDILLDLWAQTSLAEIPARPEVAPWLHGIQDNLPETWMAWRMEVPLLVNSDLTDDDISRWFQKIPISSKETLRKPTYRLKWTGTAEKKWVEKHRDEYVFVITGKGQAQRIKVEDLAEQNNHLNFATIIFPAQLGGLNKNGFFDIKTETPADDVADVLGQRMILERYGSQYRFVTLAKWMEMESQKENEKQSNKTGWFQWVSLKDAIRRMEDTQKKRAVLKLKVREAEEWQDEDELQELWLVLLREARSRAATGHGDIPTIEEHNRAVADTIKTMTEKAGLPNDIGEALLLAARYHDAGKAHDRWQRAAGFEPSAVGFKPLAKPISGGIDWRMLDGYRHELGSLLKAIETDEIMTHPESDLILHLIATHHGWARPHFEDPAFPPEIDEKTRQQVNLGIMTRYIHLQERFGYWQLAWLESLLRRADGIASAQQVAYEEVNDD